MLSKIILIVFVDGHENDEFLSLIFWGEVRGKGLFRISFLSINLFILFP